MAELDRTTLVRLATASLPALLLWIGCFDAALPPSASSPVIRCLRTGECPSELPICSTRQGLCVARKTPCVEPDGKDTADGNGCDEAETKICISGLCVEARCGDGMRSFQEECDDGNDVATDACDACRSAVCGDGVVKLGAEQCDGGASCSAECRELQCIEGIAQCSADSVVECDNAAFSVITDCPALGARCNEDGFFTFCENDVGERCYNGTDFARCVGGNCSLQGPGRGTCVELECTGAAGVCANGSYQAQCSDTASLFIECEVFGSTCVEGVGCVAPTTGTCIPGFSACGVGDGKVEPCPAEGLCVPPFIDTDGNTRGSPQPVDLPSQSTFSITPARDEDCVAFTLAEAQTVRIRAVTSGDGCVAEAVDPALQVVDSAGTSILFRDDTSRVDWCVNVTDVFEAGSYRACVYESFYGTQGELPSVSVSIDVPTVPSVTLPFSSTLPLMTTEPACFEFTLTEPELVIVDAGSLDPRCAEGMDTVASIAAAYLDDEEGNDGLCARLRTPLPAGRHVACVAATIGSYSNVPISIRIAE
jgi:cysteine-rich repeat protein